MINKKKLEFRKTVFMNECYIEVKSFKIKKIFKKIMAPQAEPTTTENKENNEAAGEIKPDPDYEWRRQAMDLIKEWQAHDNEEKDGDYRENTLLPKIKDLVRHNLTNNAEVEACDILMEIDRIEILNEMAEQQQHMDYERICLYLMSCVPFTPDPDNITLINVARDLYTKFGQIIEALCCAMKANNVIKINELFNSTTDGAKKLQMALMLGRQQIFLDIDNFALSQLNANGQLHRHFLAFARELDLMTPKTPEEVYKAHLEPTRPFNAQQMKNTPLQNLASSFVNGFVNSGFGTDAFFKNDKSTGEWLGKHKDWAAFSTAATFGLIHHWNVDSLNNFENHTQSTDTYIKAGALFAMGIVFSGVQDPDVDPAFALLKEFLFNDQLSLRVATTYGLGLAYANSKRETAIRPEDSVVSNLRRVIADDRPSANAEVKGLAALSLGLVLMGTGSENSEVVAELLTYLMGGSVDLRDPNMRFVALGIGLIFLGKQDQCDETILEPLRALPPPFGKVASILVDVCAYAGTGNVLKVQEMLYICSEHPDAQKDAKNEETTEKPPAGAPLPDITAPPAATKSSTTANGTAESGSSGAVSVAAEAGSSAAEPTTTPSKAATPPQKKVEEIESCLSQAIAVLGISLVAMGEDIGSSMSLRLFGHMYRYGEPVIRRAVPLALAMLSPSNPQLTIIETLSKYSHDSDVETARNAIFALGLVGAGTNNARVLATLRQLASYHSRDQKTMMLLRIAQGLVHLGKGTMTLNPFHSDRQLLCPTAVAALLTTCVAFIDSDQMILNGRQHYLLFTLVAAIQPRMLITVVQDPNDREQLIQKPVQVRVGQAVDVVAQAGKPRTITGFQTHTTPVLLAYGERAELADEEYVPQTPILEGIVILKKAENEEQQEEEKMEH